MNKKPKIIILNITEKCNSRCVMCGFWNKKNPEVMNIEKIKNFIENNRDGLNEVETISFVGGEPFLHENYLDFIKLYKYFPKLKFLGQPTNALAPQVYLEKIEKAIHVLPSNIYYGISISIDGIGQTHDRIRGIKNSFKNSLEFISLVKEKLNKYDNYYLTLTSTISNYNYKEITKIYDLAEKLKLRFIFRPAMEIDSDYIDNTNTSSWQWNSEVNKNIINEFNILYNKTKNDYYKLVIEMLKGKKRNYPCPFQSEGLVISPNGEVNMCLFSRQGKLGDYSHSIKDLFHSKKYNTTQENLINNDCVKCSSECNTVKSSKYKSNSYFEDQLELLCEKKYKSLKLNLLENRDFTHNNILTCILGYFENKNSENKDSEEEKIIMNTFLRKSKFSIDNNKRNNITIKYNSPSNLLAVLLNLAKYYYIIKIYKETEMYSRIIKKYFQKEINELKLLSTINKLDNLIKLQ